MGPDNICSRPGSFILFQSPRTRLSILIAPRVPGSALPLSNTIQFLALYHSQFIFEGESQLESRISPRTRVPPHEPPLITQGHRATCTARPDSLRCFR